MNGGMKVLKVLSDQIQQYMEKEKHHDQVGFIPGMQSWFRVWSVIYDTLWSLNRFGETIWQKSTSIHDQNSQQN